MNTNPLTYLVALINSDHPTLTVNRFQHESGIYFEKAGVAQLTNANWKIVVFFDMENLKTELTLFKRYIKEIQTMCISVSKLDLYCQNIIIHFNEAVKVFDARNDRIFHRNNRSKRGLVNGAAWVSPQNTCSAH